MLDGARSRCRVYGRRIWYVVSSWGMCHVFPPFPSEQEHLCLKLRQQQGSAHRNSPSQAQGQRQVKVPGKESRRSLGLPPGPEGLLLAHLLGLHWGWGRDNTGVKRSCEELPTDTDTGLLAQGRKKGSGLAPGCRPQPLPPAQPFFPAEEGKPSSASSVATQLPNICVGDGR